MYSHSRLLHPQLRGGAAGCLMFTVLQGLAAGRIQGPAWSRHGGQHAKHHVSAV